MNADSMEYQWVILGARSGREKNVIFVHIPLVGTLIPPYLEAGPTVAGKFRLPVASSETQTELAILSIILHSVESGSVYFFL